MIVLNLYTLSLPGVSLSVSELGRRSNLKCSFEYDIVELKGLNLCC